MKDTCCYFWERLLSESETKQDLPGGARIGTRVSIDAGDTVRSLVRPDSTCCGATKPVRRNYRVHMPPSPRSAAREATATSSPTATAEQPHSPQLDKA